MLVLQEPTQGVDVAAKADIHKIIRELATLGKAVLVISTDIRDLLLFVDRILAIRAGRIVGNVDTVDTDYAEVLDLTVGSLEAMSSRAPCPDLKWQRILRQPDPHRRQRQGSAFRSVGPAGLAAPSPCSAEWICTTSGH